jgi:hypothetical protein
MEVVVEYSHTPQFDDTTRQNSQEIITTIQQQQTGNTTITQNRQRLGYSTKTETLNSGKQQQEHSQYQRGRWCTDSRQDEYNGSSSKRKLHQTQMQDFERSILRTTESSIKKLLLRKQKLEVYLGGQQLTEQQEQDSHLL